MDTSNPTVSSFSSAPSLTRDANKTSSAFLQPSRTPNKESRLPFVPY